MITHSCRGEGERERKRETQIKTRIEKKFLSPKRQFVEKMICFEKKKEQKEERRFFL